jgi:ATP-dependent DNA helicase RecQ
MLDLLPLLKTHFGHTKFRPLQNEIIEHVLSGGDALVLMPTGGGKSMCFQLPALIQDGITVVISPLISLMKDQVDAALGNGIPAAFLNSTLTAEESRQVVNDLRTGKTKLLYCAPERFAMPQFRDLLRTLPIQLFAVDEAHCISEWGHDFRADYRTLSLLKTQFPTLPVIALTATATQQVADDIVEQLKIPKVKRFVSSSNRENLVYRVERKSNTFNKLVHWIEKFKGESAIVYCFSKKETDNLAQKLCDLGFKARAYHAGMTPDRRAKNQSDFINDKIDIITATIAFGMGIDKPDVRLVVHYSLPKTIEGYFQETGRAGRDGIESECVLFYGAGDQFNQKYFIRQIEDPIQQLKRYEQLNQMVDYCELKKCRRKQLLNYFGEQYPQKNCGSCDVCLKVDNHFNASEISQKIFQAINETGGRFGGSHIINILLGKNLKKIRELGHSELKSYGSVDDYNKDDISQFLASLIDMHYVKREPGMYPTLSLTEKGFEFLNIIRDGGNLELCMDEPETEIQSTKGLMKAKRKIKSNLDYNEVLFEKFRGLRMRLAEERSVPPYVIASDKTLIELAHYLPINKAELLDINGFGEVKAKRYGDEFLEMIKDSS